MLIKLINRCMGSLVKQFQIVKQSFTTEASKGEITVHVNINLSLTLDKDGNVFVSASKEEKDEQLFIVPDFEAEKLIEDFGEEVKN